MNIFSGNSLWQLVAQSDTVSKMVLLTLLCMSIACWAIFIGKLALLYVKERQFREINKRAQKAKTVSDLADIAATSSATAPGYFIAKNLSFLKELLNSSSSYMGSPSLLRPSSAKASEGFQQGYEGQAVEQRRLGQFEYEMYERNSDNIIEAILLHNEEYLSILSSCAAVGPLLGLFGTIWGLIHSFMRISESQIADIATIAPGIAEALITTIAGLVVAIPALVMFNYLHTKARNTEHYLLTLADRMTLILQQLRER